MINRKANVTNTLPITGTPLGTGFKVGSGLTGLIFGLVLVFLVLYLITIDPAQKQMWLILMIAMIVIGILAVSLLAGKRRRSYRRYRGGYSRAAPRERKVVVKHCVKCGEEIPAKAEFCEHCGEKQPTAKSKRMKKCSKCGEDIAVKAEFCEHCGEKQKD